MLKEEKQKNNTNWERSDQPRRQRGKERSDHLDNITDEARRDSSDAGSNLVRFVEKQDGTGRKVAKKKNQKYCVFCATIVKNVVISTFSGGLDLRSRHCANCANCAKGHTFFY